MSNATFVQQGASIDYTPGTGGVDAGDVVTLGNIIGVATTGIEEFVLGALAVEGVFELPKENSTTGDDMSVGSEVYWDGTECVKTATTGDVLAGTVWEAATSPATTVKVKINLGTKSAQL